MTNKERLKKMCEYIFENEAESYIEYLQEQDLTEEEQVQLKEVECSYIDTSEFLEDIATKYDHDHLWALASRVYDGILLGMED